MRLREFRELRSRKVGKTGSPEVEWSFEGDCAVTEEK